MLDKQCVLIITTTGEQEREGASMNPYNKQWQLGSLKRDQDKKYSGTCNTEQRNYFKIILHCDHK